MLRITNDSTESVIFDELIHRDRPTPSRRDNSDLSSSRTESQRYSARQDAYFNSLTSNNPYTGTPYEVRYNSILSHYQLLIEQARANAKWYEDLGLSRYTEKLIAQYTADMYAELRDLESVYRDYLTTLPENVVELQARAGLNSDLLGLQYKGSSGSAGSSANARSSALPSSDPAFDALSMGLSMIGSLTDFATIKLPSLVSSIGQIRGVSLDNDLKSLQVKKSTFSQFALENEYLREFALNAFANSEYSLEQISNGEHIDRIKEFLNLSMDEKRKLSDLPLFIDDERANSYLSQYILSSNFKYDVESLRNGVLNYSRDNAFLSETYGSDFSAMTTFYKAIGPLVRDLEYLTARFNLNQMSYDFNTVSDDVTSEIGVDGALTFKQEVSSSLDPEIAVKAVNQGNDRSYYQNKFESDVKSIFQKYTENWSKKAESGNWWSWIYDVLIMALPQFIQGLSSGSISLFRGAPTFNNSTTYDSGTKEIVSNRYFDGSTE